jgi:hypothetical protein
MGRPSYSLFRGRSSGPKRPISGANHLPLIPLAKRPLGAVLLVAVDWAALCVPTEPNARPYDSYADF